MRGKNGQWKQYKRVAFYFSEIPLRRTTYTVLDVDIKCDTWFSINFIKSKPMCFWQKLSAGVQCFPWDALRRNDARFETPSHCFLSNTHSEKQEKYTKSKIPSDVLYSLRTLICASSEGSSLLHVLRPWSHHWEMRSALLFHMTLVNI